MHTQPSEYTRANFQSPRVPGQNKNYIRLTKLAYVARSIIVIHSAHGSVDPCFRLHTIHLLWGVNLYKGQIGIHRATQVQYKLSCALNRSTNSRPFISANSH